MVDERKLKYLIKKTIAEPFTNLHYKIQILVQFILTSKARLIYESSTVLHFQHILTKHLSSKSLMKTPEQ